MWKWIAAVVLIALCAACAVSFSAPRELTALDYFEIQQLVAKYARAIDTCSNNGYDYADLFTPDGAFIPSFQGKPLAPIQDARNSLKCREVDQRVARTWGGS
jgi:hypothetical protein